MSAFPLSFYWVKVANYDFEMSFTVSRSIQLLLVSSINCFDHNSDYTLYLTVSCSLEVLNVIFRAHLMVQWALLPSHIARSFPPEPKCQKGHTS